MATNPLHNSHEAITRLAKKWRGPALTRPLWSIIDWPLHFENSHTRKLARLPFVLLPTKHDGKSYRRLMRHEKKGDIFACWCLITQIAAKSAARGYLADEDGPYTPLDMADMTGMSLESFTLALEILASDDIRWIHQCTPDTLPQSPDTLPQSPESIDEINDLQQSGDSPDHLPTTRENSGAREEKRREVKGREEAPYRPQGDQTQPDSIGTNAAAQKKEGPAPGSMEAITLTVAKICSYFPKRTAKVLSAAGMHGLRTIAEALPLADADWIALDAIFDARKKEGPGAEDFTLRHGWLTNAEALAQNLLAAVDIARDWCRGSSAPARTRTDGFPDDWRERFAEKFPGAVAGSWDDLTKAQQAEVRA